MPKLKNFRIRMESPDGKQSRTIELAAEDKDGARRRAERQADDIADQESGGDETKRPKAYVVKKIDEVK